MDSDRYFYHSFSRPNSGVESIEKGTAILKSIALRGLLATPEKYSVREQLDSGDYSDEIEIYQKRICFTELSPKELKKHREYFGSFALEWDIKELMKLGAIPVFYMNHFPLEDGHAPLGATLIARLAEIQKLLNNLANIQKVCETTSSMETLNITQNDKVILETSFTVGEMLSVLRALSYESQSFDQLSNTLQYLSGYFYSTENPTYNDELLFYYRQREWRILPNLLDHGQRLSRDLDQNEIKELLEIDSAFFSRVMEFRTGSIPRANQCMYVYDADKILDSVRRIIIPDETEDYFKSYTPLNPEKIITVSKFDSLYK